MGQSSTWHMERLKSISYCYRHDQCPHGSPRILMYDMTFTGPDPQNLSLLYDLHQQLTKTVTRCLKRTCLDISAQIYLDTGQVIHKEILTKKELNFYQNIWIWSSYGIYLCCLWVPPHYSCSVSRALAVDQYLIVHGPPGHPLACQSQDLKLSAPGASEHHPGTKACLTLPLVLHTQKLEDNFRGPFGQIVTTRNCPHLSLPSNRALFDPARSDFHQCPGELSQQACTGCEEYCVENVGLTMIPESASVSSPLEWQPKGAITETHLSTLKDLILPPIKCDEPSDPQYKGRREMQWVVPLILCQYNFYWFEPRCL